MSEHKGPHRTHARGARVRADRRRPVPQGHGPDVRQHVRRARRAEIDRRQAQVQQRTTTAKSIGQVAMTFGVPMVRQRVEREVDSARQRAQSFLGTIGGVTNGTPSAPPRAASRRRRAAPPADQRHQRVRTANGGATNARRPTPRRPPATRCRSPATTRSPRRRWWSGSPGSRRRARRGAHLRRRAPQPPHDSRQDRSDLRVGINVEDARRDPRRPRARRRARARIPGRAAAKNGAARSGRRARRGPSRSPTRSPRSSTATTRPCSSAPRRARRRLRDRAGRGAARRPRLGVIEEIYVETEARAVGVGELLVERLVAFCVDAGCVGVDAAALPGHRQAKNFFERAGFTARLLVMHKPQKS